MDRVRDVPEARRLLHQPLVDRAGSHGQRRIPRFLLSRLKRFITALERQTGEHGFAVCLHRQEVLFHPPQAASLAVDLKAVDLFRTGDSPLPPLPRSLDRSSELADGSPFPESDSSHLGGDDLMLSLWRLSQVTGRDSEH